MFHPNGMEIRKGLMFVGFFLFGSMAKTSAQNRYDSLIRVADSLYERQNFEKAIVFYRKAFKAAHYSGVDYYSLSKAYAHTGRIGKSFRALQKIFRRHYHAAYKAPQAGIFLKVAISSRFKKLIQEIRLFKAGIDSVENVSVSTLLSKLNQESVVKRVYLDSLFRVASGNEAEIGKISHEIRLIDSVNTLELEKIIDEHGWPGYEITNEEGCIQAFELIQHAKTLTQNMVKALIKGSMKKGMTPRYLYAYFDDRIRLANGKKQRYGTQLEFDRSTGKQILISKTKMSNLNSRRRKMELPSLEAYLKAVNF